MAGLFFSSSAQITYSGAANNSEQGCDFSTRKVQVAFYDNLSKRHHPYKILQ